MKFIILNNKITQITIIDDIEEIYHTYIHAQMLQLL